MKKYGVLVLAGLLAVGQVFGHAGQKGSAIFTVQQYAEGKVPWTHLDANKDQDNFQFAVVGDRTGGMRPGVFSNAMHQVNLMQPEFVVSVGDLISGQRISESADAIDAMWNEFDGIVKTLEMPFFYVSGNHDCFNPLLGEKWTERLGPSYYSFEYRDVRFVVLNTQFIINEKNQWPGKHEEQLQFLKETVAIDSDVRWTVVVVHHPMWMYEDEERYPATFHGLYAKWLEVEALLENRKYTVFAGHTHHYNKEERNGRNHITLATTGAGSKLRGAAYGEFDHFLWVTMTDDGPIIANLLLEGVLDTDPAPPPN